MLWYNFAKEITETIISFFPEPQKDLAVLSNRRNKGLLAVENKRSVRRRLDMAFFNSGSNDGLPSSLIRECIILRGRLAGHPNVVSLTSINCMHDSPEVELVYPFFPVSLRQFRDRNDEISTGLIRNLAVQLFRAVAFLRAQQVLHGNIRMENLMVNEETPHEGKNLTLKLTDFSHAKFLESCNDDVNSSRLNRSHTHTERARLIYACPGQPCDVWSSGVVLLELLDTVPWASSFSETEFLIRLTQALGSFASSHWMLPETRKPDWINIAKNIFLCENDEKWKKIRTQRGPHPVLLLGRLLSVDPSHRCSAKQALESGFLMDFSEEPEMIDLSIDWYFTSDGPCASPLSLPYVLPLPVPRWTPEQRTEWIGSFLFPISRILECHTSRPVHTAVSLFHALPPSSERDDRDPSPILVACLKIAARLDVSKDMFKQVCLIEIASSIRADETTFVKEVVECEKFLISNIDSIIDCFRTTSWDWVQYLSTGRGHNFRSVAEYIADIALMDSALSTEHTCQIAGIACVIVAAQWLGIAEFSLVHFSLSVSVDAVQIAVSRCTNLLSEKRASIIVMNNGTTHKILQNFYRNRIPCTVPSVWQTSRTFIESIVGSRARGSPIRVTPPKPARLRFSTLQHAKDWAIQSLRRRRRSRSSTPLPSSRSKRLCMSPALTPRKSSESFNN